MDDDAYQSMTCLACQTDAPGQSKDRQRSRGHGGIEHVSWTESRSLDDWGRAAHELCIIPIVYDQVARGRIGTVRAGNC
jgi:hypothetical protein